MVRFPPLANPGSAAVRSTYIDDRPTTDLLFGKISNGDISARGHPIHFMFGCRLPGWVFGVGGSNGFILSWPNSIGMREKTMREE